MLLVHGVDRLVLLGVSLVVRDVGRQGYMSRLVHRLVERALPHRGEADETTAAAVVHEVEDLAREHDGGGLGRMRPTGAVLDESALLESLAGVDQALPHVSQGVQVLASPQEERLGDATRAALAPDEPRGHHAGPVGHEKVTWIEVVHDVPEDAMLDGAVVPIEDEEPAGVAGLGGSLGDELAGELVVKVVGTHGASSSGFTAANDSAAGTGRARTARNRYASSRLAALRASRAAWRSTAASAAEKRHPQ